MQNTENEVNLLSSSPIITPLPEFVPGRINQDHFGILKDIDIELEADENESSNEIEVTVTKEFQTKLSRVSYLSSSHNDALWIGINMPTRENKRSTLFSKKTITLHKVRPEENKLKTLCELDVRIIDIATTPSDTIILVTDDVKLKEIDQSDKVIDSKYNVESYLLFMFKPTCIHFTKRNTIAIGGRTSSKDRAAVILMDINGKFVAKYESDETSRPIFTNPLRITSTSNGNLWVIDAEDDNSGSVVVLTQEYGVRVYRGNLDMDTCEKQFNPQYITTTPLDNIIVTDTYNHMLHLLNKDIQLLAHYSTGDIGILYPTSVVFTSAGNVYIGSSSFQQNEKAKLYKVNFVEY
ncbi:unnamed protein product [Mytilus edulis]|uniref:Uncharacterized protein n=1 Tax=Mytilus edulis TaxID=6550 RepID=A0A8S3U014_MYTED|nr:unnamed protein product [Mytilus edulis]